TDMPSVLIETAFLSNPGDAALLAQSTFIDRIVAGIVHGISEYTGGPQTPLGQSRSARPPNS
ncbi:MAG: N-acetylmuramoyl-L-alanine amidase, partial [Candidatus Eremiobacteraeota bacterium]|nr:N-acetylmuramoyl-L-alanine amidase [Candidatus Eremiobacteraeota bacterium]